MSEIILASASPRRKELLANMGLDFSVVVSDADEAAIDSDVPSGIYVQELALIKAAVATEKVLKNKNAIIIAADTVVVNNGEILGKPRDENHARQMLSFLSGKTHQVYTGVCVMRICDAYTVCKDVCTEVTFKTLTDEKINGDYFNVVGLPVSTLAEILETDFSFVLM